MFWQHESTKTLNIIWIRFCNCKHINSIFRDSEWLWIVSNGKVTLKTILNSWTNLNIILDHGNIIFDMEVRFLNVWRRELKKWKHGRLESMLQFFFSVEAVISKYSPTNYLLITQQGHSNSPDDEHCWPWNKLTFVCLLWDTEDNHVTPLEFLLKMHNLN